MASKNRKSKNKNALNELNEQIHKEGLGSITGQELMSLGINKNKPLGDELREYLGAKETAANNNGLDKQSFEDIYSFQKTSLYMKRIAEGEYEDEHDKLLQNTIIQNRHILEDPELTERKSVSVINKIMDEISKSDLFSEVRAQVDKDIKSIDIAGDLVGYNKNAKSTLIKDPQALESLQLAKLYHIEVLDEPHDTFKDKMSKSKNSVMGFLKNPNTKLALSSLAFTGSVVAGGGLPLVAGGVRMVAAINEHEKAKEFFKGIGDSIVNTADRLGIDAKPAVGMFAKVADKLTKMSKTKKFMAASLLLGVGGISAIESGLVSNPDVVSAYADAKSSLQDAFGVEAGELNASNDDLNNSAVEADGEDVPIDTAYTAGDKYYVWDMAKDHFEAMTGEKPTKDQLIAMIDDLGMDNPNYVQDGQVVKFPNDMDAYTADKVKGIKEPEWFNQPDANTTVLDDEMVKDGNSDLDTEPVTIDADAVKNSVPAFKDPNSMLANSSLSPDSASGLIPLVTNDNLEDLIKANWENEAFQDRLMAFYNANEGADLTHRDLIIAGMSPGDSFVMTDGTEFVAPTTEETVMSMAFPDGGDKNRFLDAGKIMDAIQNDNPNVDFHNGVFDFGDNENLFSQISNYGVDFSAIDVDYSLKSTEFDVSSHIPNGNTHHLKEGILNSMFGGEIPDAIDRDAVIKELAQANPELESVLYNNHGDKNYFSGSIVVPDSLSQGFGIDPDLAKELESEKLAQADYNNQKNNSGDSLDM